MSDTNPTGIRAYAAQIPRHLLATTKFGPVDPEAPVRRARAVANHDEDSLTLAVEAAGRLGDELPGPLVFATSEPPYLDKSSAATLHAALELPDAVPALDLAGLRSGAAALRTALATGGTAVIGDVRTPAPGAPDELGNGDAAAAFACGGDGPLAATLLGGAGMTRELLERWRLPGERHPNVWDERFTAEELLELLRATAAAALADAGLEQVDHVVVACANQRVAKPARKALGAAGADAEVEALVGHAGAAHVGVLLADALDRAKPGETILVASAADGADAFVLRAEEGVAAARRGPSVRDQLAARTPISYDRYLRWRGILEIKGAPRPDPQAPASPPMLRRSDWKYGLVGERCRACGVISTPPGRVCPSCGKHDEFEPVSLRRTPGTVVSFTADHLAPSVDPPVVLAVVDLDGGGRRSVEVTDLPAEGIAVGARVVPTFRRLFTSEGVHNYFWKVRPVEAS